jgi:hypothetical protein
MTPDKLRECLFEQWYNDGIGSPEDLLLARSNANFIWQAAIAAFADEVCAELETLKKQLVDEFTESAQQKYCGVLLVEAIVRRLSGEKR